MRYYFLSLFIFSTQIFALPDFYTQNINNIPNICQTCFPQLIKWEGKPHCAPAAVANSLFWFGMNGYPALRPYVSSNPLIDQAKLVDLLGEKMNTSKNSGTSPHMMFNGLKNFLDENKIKYQRMAATGWRDVPAFVIKDDPMTKLDWIKQGTLEKNAIWILIGWCKFNAKEEDYKIYDGHWMTVVGYGKNQKGELDSNVIILHDPAQRALRQNYYATISTLTKGTIDHTRQAQGVLYLTGDVILKPGADFGIIQGAYRLEL